MVLMPLASMTSTIAGSPLSAAMFVTGLLLLLVTFGARRRRRLQRRMASRSGLPMTAAPARGRPANDTPCLDASNPRDFIDRVRANAAAAAVRSARQTSAVGDQHPAATAAPSTGEAEAGMAAPSAGIDRRSVEPLEGRSGPPLRLVGGNLRDLAGGPADITMRGAELRLADLDQHAREMLALLENRVQTLHAMLQMTDDRILLLDELLRREAPSRPSDAATASRPVTTAADSPAPPGPLPRPSRPAGGSTPTSASE